MTHPKVCFGQYDRSVKASRGCIACIYASRCVPSREDLSEHIFPQPVDYELPEPAPSPAPSATSILECALSHMEDRAKTYDAPSGERSMGKTVEASNTVTGQKLTEEQGWLFMVLLKAVRSQQGGHREDNYEDLAAYAGLMGEAAAVERKA